MSGRTVSLPPGGEPLAPAAVRRVSIVCFFAWVFSVFDYTLFGTLLPAISDDYGWSSSTATNVSTWITLGTFVVSLVVGPMLDRWGRRSALAVTTAGAAVVSGLTALAGGKLSMILIRALSGLGYSEEVVNSVYLNEVYGNNRRRGFMYSFVQSGWPVGALLSALVSAVLLSSVGWHGVFLIATFPAVVIVVLVRRLPESPVFVNLKRVRELRAEGREAEAVALAKAAGVEAGETGRLRDIFTPQLRRHTLCLSAAWLLNWMGIQVFSVLGTTVLTEAKGVSFDSALLVLILANAAGFAGYITHGYVGDRFGRRPTIIVGWLLGGVAMTLMLIGPASPAFVVPLYMLGLFFLLGPYAALLFYMGESYPAKVRGIGPNTAHIMGPIGAIAGSAVLSVLLSADLSMGTAAFFAGAVGIFLSGVAMIGARRTDQELRRPTRQPAAADTPAA
ncbi:MFS transporter [Actinomadura keratinilytica]|uniref:MFS transporter n=1 Tax=Actinomadura keratinilytica TaxID=547461 RepID=UPI0031E85934